MCSFFETKVITIFSLLDFLNRIVIPFSLMTVSSLLLIKPLLDSNNNQETSKSLTICSILLNISSISLTIPVLLKSLFSITESSFTFTFWIFYLSYSVKFYIILCTHPSVLEQFLILFRLRSPTDESVQIRYTHIQLNNTESNQEVLQNVILI